jgi:hypothetical protein
MRPRAPTIGEFPAPPPAGSRTPSKPPHRAASMRPSAGAMEAASSATPRKERDPLDIVREAIGELDPDFIDSAQAAAGICASALKLALGPRAVFIHAYDNGSKEIRIVAANGPKSEELMGKAALVEDDALAAMVTVSQGPTILSIDPEVGLPRRAPERLKAVGAQNAVVAVPAMLKKRVVAIIEIVDAKESAASAVEPAAEYAALQLAKFLEERRKK